MVGIDNVPMTEMWQETGADDGDDSDEFGVTVLPLCKEKLVK